MYKNLSQAPPQEPLYVSAIIDAKVASMLAESNVVEGLEIVKTGEGTFQSQGRVVEIGVSETGAKLTISVAEAKEILVRACDICWHCGECMIEE